MVVHPLQKLCRSQDDGHWLQRRLCDLHSDRTALLSNACVNWFTMALRQEALRWTSSSTGLPPGTGTALRAPSSINCLTCFPVSGSIIAGKFQFSGCVIRAAGQGRTMKRSKFTEAQIAFILRQAEEGTTVGEVCRKAGISEATYYNWRKKYAGLTPSEMKRLRQLEEENTNLKKIVADLSLDKAMLQDVIRRKL